MSKLRTVTVFGSSLPVGGSAIYSDALRLGKLLAEAGFAVCSGGFGGVNGGSSRGACEMMNKSSLSETIGGQKPLLVMAYYWKPVITCLEQEAQLVPGESKRPLPAMNIITLVDTVDEMVEILRPKLRS